MNDSEVEVGALQKQVNDLQQQLQIMAVSHQVSGPSNTHVWRNREADGLKTSRGPGSNKALVDGSGEYFCYRCGEDGHVATRCSAPEDSGKVISRLICSLRRQKGEKREAPSNSSGARDTNCIIKKSNVHVSNPTKLPEGLIGKPSFSPVKIEGHWCNALMDNGSTVTIVLEKWYRDHLSHIIIHPISSLCIWGLSDTSYPYRDYVAINMDFPNDGKKARTHTVLALVCPDRA